MAYMAVMRRNLVLLVCVACFAGFAFSTFVNPYNDPKHPAVKSDIQYIKCQVCDNIIKQARRKVQELRMEADTSKRKLTEDIIIEHLEKMCNPELASGGWITRLDMVENARSIDLVDVGQYGKCTTECRTIARACDDILEDTDLAELSEHLYKDSKQRAALSNWLCYEETDACVEAPPHVPKSRIPGPPHEAISEEEFNTKQMMASMQESGLKGQMYNTEELLDRMKHMPREPGDGPDDEDLLEMYDKIKAEREAYAKTIAGRLEAAASRTQEYAQLAIGRANEVAQKMVTVGRSLYYSAKAAWMNMAPARQQREKKTEL